MRSQRTASSGYSRVDQQLSKCDSGSKRCKQSRLRTLDPRGSPHSQHFKITETKEGGMMVIARTQVTQMHDIVKTLQDGPQRLK